jgi:hypothetical protein
VNPAKAFPSDIDDPTEDDYTERKKMMKHEESLISGFIFLWIGYNLFMFGLAYFYVWDNSRAFGKIILTESSHQINNRSLHLIGADVKNRKCMVIVLNVSCGHLCVIPAHV